MAEYRLRIDTTGDRALEFVTRLAQDDDFRARLESDPRSVLWDYGIEVSDELIPAEVVLPSKDDVQAVIDQGPEGVGMLQVGPAAFHPVFSAFFAFPFLTSDEAY